MQIKQYSIRILAKIFRILGKFFTFLWQNLGFMRRGVFFLGRGIFKGLIFPFYKFLYYLKYKLLNIYAPAKSKVFYILNKGYLVHALIIVIACFLVVGNINAQELREESFGEKTVIYSLITKEVYEELSEETQIEAPSTQVLSYLDRTGALSTPKAGMESNAPVEDQMITDLSTLTEGGVAVVKPNIIKPITREEAKMLEQVETTKRYGVDSYVVQSGDTVSSIATKFGVSVNTILWQNGLSSRSLIKPGATLEILPTSGVSHKVKSGETLGAIAKKYKVDLAEIVSHNNLTDEGDIKIAQKLIIPGGKISAPVRRATTRYTQVAPISQIFKPGASAASSGSGFVWPAGVRRISQYYSWRHKGLDIAGPTGTPLYASESGVVEYAGWLSGYGYNVVINHGNGMKTRYAHASKYFVNKGASVAKGQHIAAMGSTGWSTGPHIHYEVIVNGVKKNPLSYIK